MQVMFPKEEAQTAALEMRLSTAPISEVNEAELFRKTEQAVSAVFAAAGRRTDKKIAASRQIREIGQGIDYLTIAKDRLPYTEIAERLDQLQLMILSCRPTTDYLKNQVENLRRQWNHLRFPADFPIAEELDPDLQFAERISRSVAAHRGAAAGSARKSKAIAAHFGGAAKAVRQSREGLFGGRPTGGHPHGKSGPPDDGN